MVIGCHARYQANRQEQLVLLKDTLTCPWRDRTCNPPTARPLLLPPEPLSPWARHVNTVNGMISCFAPNNLDLIIHYSQLSHLDPPVTALCFSSSLSPSFSLPLWTDNHIQTNCDQQENILISIPNTYLWCKCKRRLRRIYIWYQY